MKKIIKSSMLLLAVCCFAGKVNAQLSSEKPAMTANQVNDLIKSRSVAKTAPASTVAVASQTPSSTMPVRVASDAAKASAAPALPAVSDQGGVKPASDSPASAKPAGAEITPGSKVVDAKEPAAVPVKEVKPVSKS